MLSWARASRPPFCCASQRMPAELSARSVGHGGVCAARRPRLNEPLLMPTVWYYMVLYGTTFFSGCRRRVAASQVYVDALLAPRRAALAIPAFALTSQRRLASRALERTRAPRASGRHQG